MTRCLGGILGQFLGRPFRRSTNVRVLCCTTTSALMCVFENATSLIEEEMNEIVERPSAGCHPRMLNCVGTTQVSPGLSLNALVCCSLYYSSPRWPTHLNHWNFCMIDPISFAASLNGSKYPISRYNHIPVIIWCTLLILMHLKLHHRRIAIC